VAESRQPAEEQIQKWADGFVSWAMADDRPDAEWVVTRDVARKVLLAQRDVVAAVHELQQAEGIEATEAARQRLFSVAAVVSGTPPPEEQT